MARFCHQGGQTHYIMKTKLIALISFIAIIALYSCKKESGSTTIRVLMTDAPIAMEEVNIDLQSVEIKFSSDTSKWLTLNANAGIYNLLGLQNGVDTLIAQGTFPGGFVKEIRLIVGADNTVKVDGQVYPLTIPSGAETGLKIKVNKNLQAPIETLLIDFDAALSINNEADGYKLRPVIQLK
jgi:hypothetical protein